MEKSLANHQTCHDVSQRHENPENEEVRKGSRVRVRLQKRNQGVSQGNQINQSKETTSNNNDTHVSIHGGEFSLKNKKSDQRNQVGSYKRGNDGS